jgi:hypothetical protein
MHARTRKVVTFAFFLAVMLSGLELALAKDRHETLPPKVMSARTIYVDNQSNDAELQHDAYMGLSRWGRFSIVDAPQKADLVLRLFGSSLVKLVPAGSASATYNPTLVSAKSTEIEELAPPGYTRIMLVEPKSGNPLWSETRKTTNGQEKGKLLDGLHEAVDQQEKNHGK